MPLFNPKTLYIEGSASAPVENIDFTGDVTITVLDNKATVNVGGAGGTAAGSNEQIQFNNALAFAGATKAVINNNDLTLLDGTPVAPASGQVKMFHETMGGRSMLAMVGPSGLDTAIQPSIARNKVAFWNPIGNATTAPLTFGLAAPSTLGTATTRNVATTNLFTSMKRIGYVSSTTAGNLAAAYVPAVQFWRGNAAGLGGFSYVCRFGTSDGATVSGARMFVGLIGSASAPTNVEPNTLLNCIGVGQLSTSANIHLIYNDGAGAAQTADFGATFPANTLSTKVYELAMFAPPNGSNVVVVLRNLSDGLEQGITLSTDIPASTTLLAPTMWRSNNATALAVGIDLMGLYIETDY